MPSLGDSAVIFFLALLLFGPKKLPELARQLGKLMAEFRRASNEFKYQMEEEFRQMEQAEKQKKIAAESSAVSAEASADAGSDAGSESKVADTCSIYSELEAEAEKEPIATSGKLAMMPPATGLPVEKSDEDTAADQSGDSVDSSEVAAHG